jgi:hypothetical protein
MVYFENTSVSQKILASTEDVQIFLIISRILLFRSFEKRNKDN